MYASALERRKSIAPTIRDLERAGDMTIVDQLGDDIEELVAIIERVDRAHLLPDEAGIGVDPRPDDNARQAYDWGYHAASRARDALGIAHDNPQGRIEFFEKLGFEPSASADIGSPVSTVFPIQGAVSRTEKQIKLALSSGTDKEFSAARASFLAWVSESNSSRLVTTSKTRQQRASRAFGAELLAPAKFLKKRLGREYDVSPFTLDKISADIGVASTIVRLQAQNNGFRILDAT